MSDIHEYAIVERYTASEVEQAVQDYIRCGWRPWGQLHVVLDKKGITRYTQPVVVKKP